MFRKDVTSHDAPSPLGRSDKATNHEKKPKPIQPPATAGAAEVVDANERLAKLAQSIRGHRRNTVAEILAVGQQLREARDLLAKHGKDSYRTWLREVVYGADDNRDHQKHSESAVRDEPFIDGPHPMKRRFTRPSAATSVKKVPKS